MLQLWWFVVSSLLGLIVLIGESLRKLGVFTTIERIKDGLLDRKSTYWSLSLSVERWRAALCSADRIARIPSCQYLRTLRSDETNCVVCLGLQRRDSTHSTVRGCAYVSKAWNRTEELYAIEHQPQRYPLRVQTKMA